MEAVAVMKAEVEVEAHGHRMLLSPRSPRRRPGHRHRLHLRLRLHLHLHLHHVHCFQLRLRQPYTNPNPNPNKGAGGSEQARAHRRLHRARTKDWQTGSHALSVCNTAPGQLRAPVRSATHTCGPYLGQVRYLGLHSFLHGGHGSVRRRPRTLDST